MKWIAIDFGTRYLKFLKFNLDGQRIRFEDFKTFDSKPDYYKGLGVPDNNAWAAATIALNELDWLKPEDELIFTSALPSAYLESRYLRFPVRSMKKIEKILPIELESAIPFDIEDIQIRNRLLEGDFITGQKKEGLVLSMAYRRDLIKAYETELRKFQTSSPGMTVQNLALISLRQAIDEDSLFGVMEFGHSKTQLIIVNRSGDFLGCRTFWWGGLNLGKAISEHMGVDISKGLQILPTLTSATPLPEAVERPMRSFAVDLRQTLKGIRGGGVKLPNPFPLYVYGRPLQCHGLTEAIVHCFKTGFAVDLKPYPFDKLRSGNLQGLENIPDLGDAAQAISIALHQLRQNRNKIPTFSETTFQFQQNLKKIKTDSFSVLRRVAVLMIFPLIFFISSIYVQTKENKIILGQLGKLLQSASVKWKEGVSSDEVVKILKKELANNRKKLTLLEHAQKSPLLELTKISRTIPADLKLDVKEFKVTVDRISVRAESPNQSIADDIVANLKTVYPKIDLGGVQPCKEKQNCVVYGFEIERGSKP